MVRRLVAGRRVGALKSAVLELLWSARGSMSGREVWERLGDDTPAYTTVMTVLGRLVEKGLVERSAEGGSHRYRAAGDPGELTAQAIESLLGASPRTPHESGVAPFLERRTRLRAPLLPPW